jgi:energy-converting hydrogenase Eha subunit C
MGKIINLKLVKLTSVGFLALNLVQVMAAENPRDTNFCAKTMGPASEVVRLLPYIMHIELGDPIEKIHRQSI